MSTEFAKTLQELLLPQLEDEAGTWLAQAIDGVRQAGDPAGLATSFAEAARRVGRGSLLAPGSEAATLTVDRFTLPLSGWRRGDAARALLLIADGERDADHPLTWAAARYFAGDAQERTSLLRLFALLPGIDLSLPVGLAPSMDTSADTPRIAALRAVLDATRHSNEQLFDAATAGNVFFSAAVPELEFNKAVLKRVFLDLPADVVLGLKERANAELSRMLLNLIEEREISYRPWPVESLPILAYSPAPGLLARLIGYLENSDDRIRASAGVALLEMGETAAVSARFAVERLGRESQQPVIDALQRLIDAHPSQS